MFIYESKLILIYCVVIFAILGAVMGSFLNCAAWRISRNESFTKGRSHCPSCGHELSAADLIPVFSWLFLRGKCRYCGSKVSVRYLLAELFMAAMFVLALLRFGITVELFRNLVLLCLLFLLSMVDLEIFEIPDSCHIIAAVLWAATCWFVLDGISDIIFHIIAAVVYGGGILLISMIFDKLLNKESMGGGDIKLFAVMGLYLGLAPSLLALILSCVIGLIFAFIRKRITPDASEEFPFGPSIALAFWIVLLYGGPVIDWYMGFFNF